MRSSPVQVLWIWVFKSIFVRFAIGISMPSVIVSRDISIFDFTAKLLFSVVGQ